MYHRLDCVIYIISRVYKLIHPLLWISLRAISSTPFTLAPTSFKDKEKAEEAAFFNREEQILLQKLVSKVKTMADKKEGVDHEDDIKELKNILGKDVSKSTINKLIDWKFHSVSDE